MYDKYLMNDLQDIYEKLINEYSEEEIYEHFINFVVIGLQQKEQYKFQKKASSLIDLFYELIELKKNKGKGDE